MIYKEIQEPIEFEINDITNVDELEFNLVFRSDDGAGDVYVLLSDVILKENPIVGQPNENDNVQKLSSMKIINYNENFEKISTHSMTDIFGNVYLPDNLFELETYGESIWRIMDIQRIELPMVNFTLINSTKS